MHVWGSKSIVWLAQLVTVNVITAFFFVAVPAFSGGRFCRFCNSAYCGLEYLWFSLGRCGAHVPDDRHPNTSLRRFYRPIAVERKFSTFKPRCERTQENLKNVFLPYIQLVVALSYVCLLFGTYWLKDTSRGRVIFIFGQSEFQVNAISHRSNYLLHRELLITYFGAHDKVSWQRTTESEPKPMTLSWASSATSVGKIEAVLRQAMKTTTML